jgi:hypothetical protein
MRGWALPFDEGYAAPTAPHLDSASVGKRLGMRGRRLIIGEINGLGWAGDTALIVQAIETVLRQGFDAPSGPSLRG